MAEPFYVPPSLLQSLGITSAQAQAGQFTKGAGATAPYTPKPQSTGTVLDALEVAKAAAAGQSGNFAPGSWQANVATSVNPSLATANPKPTTNTGGLGGLGGFDMNALLQQITQGQQSQMSAWQKSQTDMMAEWQKALGANFGKTYNPTGIGGSFSNVSSPVYRPGGETDTGTQAANGWGGSWGNGPFRETF